MRQTESEANFIGGFLASFRSIVAMAKVLAFIVVITIGLVARIPLRSRFASN